MKALCLGSLFLLGLLDGAVVNYAAGPQILPVGTRPDDHRLGPLKDLNGYFPFQPPNTKEAWSARAEVVRRRVLVANGLWPFPEKTLALSVAR